MLGTLLNLFYHSLLITVLIVLSLLGAFLVRAMWNLIFHPFAIFASLKEKAGAFLVLTVELVATVSVVIAILHLLTGGGTNAH